MRRTISAAVSGRRDELNTRSRVQMAALLIPHMKTVVACRATSLAKKRGLADFEYALYSAGVDWDKARAELLSRAPGVTA